MAVCVEKSRDVGTDRAILHYVITAAADYAAALAALAAAAPATVSALSRDSVAAEEQLGADGVWMGTAEYRLMPTVPKEVGQSTYQFDTGGGTQHITQAKYPVDSWAPGSETPPDFQGAIGVTHDTVEGCDVVLPVYNFSETHYFAAGTVNNTYKGTLFGLTGKINDAAFKGFAAGEVLFLGASGSQRGDGAWEVTFRFAASPNATGLTIGGITGISKLGWDYLWVRYKDAEDGDAKSIVKVPASVHVEQVYDSGSFSGLGIGTT